MVPTQNWLLQTVSLPFARDLEGIRVIVTVNNDDSDSEMNLPTGSAPEYVGALTGQKVSAQGGRIRVRVAANSGEIWLPAGDMPEYKPVQTNVLETAVAKENENAASEAEEEQAAENSTVTEAAPEKELQTLKIQIKLLTIQQTQRIFRQLLKQNPPIHRKRKRSLRQIRTKHQKK